MADINKARGSESRDNQADQGEVLTSSEAAQLLLLKGSHAVEYKGVRWMVLMGGLPGGDMGLTIGCFVRRAEGIQCTFALNGLRVQKLNMFSGSLQDLRDFLRSFKVVDLLPPLSIRGETRGGVSCVSVTLAEEELEQ